MKCLTIPEKGFVFTKVILSLFSELKLMKIQYTCTKKFSYIKKYK